MAGHNKWTQIKRQKAKTDGAKARIFTKYAKLICNEAKKSRGNLESPGLASAIERARKENMPNDSIERAIKKAVGDSSAQLELLTYECFGPGGCAILIEALTANRNKASAEIKHILSTHNSALGVPGSASWAFTKEDNVWTPLSPVELSEDELEKLQLLIEDLEANEEVQEVITNVA